MVKSELCLAALEMLVEFKISGLPVVDDDERVVRCCKLASLSSHGICVTAARSSQKTLFWAYRVVCCVSASKQHQAAVKGGLARRSRLSGTVLSV